MEVIQLIASGKNDQAIKMLEDKSLLKYREGKRLRNRERSELEKKLLDLNLAIPWTK